MPRKPVCGYIFDGAVIRDCVDCGCPMECRASRTKQRTLCDDCKSKHKAKTASTAAWGKTARVKCADCGFWFNRTAVSTEAICSPCRTDTPLCHGKPNTYARGCRCDECKAGYQAYRQGKPRPESKPEHPCAKCGSPFAGYRRRKYCSMDCWENRSPYGQRQPKGNYRRRAAQWGVAYEPLRRNDVYDRDNWTCGICGEPVDPDLQYPHRRSVSLDHVIPFARGGPHTPSNVQCSHLECNILKRDNA